ncbi:MAG: hypothetical protein O7G85_12910, partial [Planctomycetota bacterium]|nr:hypothetical protein [Planctomycetota bacterium]
MNFSHHPADQAGTNLEIERKFLLDGLPDIPSLAERLEIEQGYLAQADSVASEIGTTFSQGRLRRITFENGSVRYIKTFKHGEGLVREETNIELDREAFERDWPMTNSRRLTKTRFRLPLGELLWEVDHVHGLEVFLAEVEMPSPDTVVEIPDWLEPHIVREVTDEPA